MVEYSRDGKWLIISAMILTASLCFAARASESQRFDPYVGLGIGYGGTVGHYQHARSQSLAVHGLEGSLHMGLGKRFDDWALAVEAGYAKGQIKVHLKGTSGSLLGQNDLSLKDKDTLFFDLRPSILVGRNTDLYSRIGFARTRISLTTDQAGTGTRYVNGGRLGAGLEHWLSPQVSIGAGVVYTRYKRLNYNEDLSLRFSSFRANGSASFHFLPNSKFRYENSSPIAAVQNGNFYLGLMGRYGVAKASLDHDQGGQTASADGVGIHGASVGGYAGYGVNLGNVYLGGEIGYRHWGPAYKGSAADKWIEVSLRDSLLAGVRIGFYPSSGKLLYARTSLVSSRMIANAQRDSGLSLMYKNSRILGGNVAAGIEFPVISKLVARMEADYSMYEEFSTSYGQGQLQNVRFSDFGVNAGFSYYF